jgi:hypothetical protein
VIEVLKSSDPVRLNFLRAVLEEADLHPFVMSASAYPGVLASRLMVPDGEADLARRLIAEVEKGI